MSDESPAVGGSGKSGDEVRRELARAARSESEEAQRLYDGTAWREFCRALEEAGERVLAFPVGETEVPGQLRAEGMQYLLGLVKSGIFQALELSEGMRPRIVRNPDSEAKWGAENVDNQYLWTRIDPREQYRIEGNAGSAFEALLETKDGYMQLGDDRVFETLLLTDLQREANGDFEILLSAERPSGHRGNWMKLEPDARYFTVRQYFVDWAKETPARFEIYRVGGEGVAPPAMTPARMAGLLDEAGTWTLQTTKFWMEWVEQLRKDHRKGELREPRPFVGGAKDIVYGNDWWSLDPDEAMIVETELPDARYWQVQLCDVWFRTFDFATRQTGLNAAQARVDSDGKLRCVIAHRDPGVQNWLDTAGHPEGMIQYRWIWTKDRPHPKVRIVPFAQLRDALPDDTPAYAEAERKAALAIRHRHLFAREPVT